MNKSKRGTQNESPLWNIILYGVFAILVLIGCIFLYYEFREYDRARERDITKQSLEYQESQITQLQTIMDSWLKLEVDKNQTEDSSLVAAYNSQQVALIERMSIIANRIEDDAIPDHIIEFLINNRSS